MTKERIKQSISENHDSVRELESQKYSGRDLKDAIESGPVNTYEWFEDNVILKKAFVELKKDETGKDSATIRMKNPDTNKDEAVYYTTDETEVARLKEISEGGTVIVDETEL